MANEDLIGFKYTTAEGTPAEEEIEVVSTCEWSDSYVTVRFPTGHETIKPVVAVRMRKEIDQLADNWIADDAEKEEALGEG